MPTNARAGIMWNTGEPWTIDDVEIGDPAEGEVLIEFAASGLCHSDEHARTGDMPITLPMLGGHEGAGIVTGVGPGVTNVKEGDHVVTSFMPVCGRCRWCLSGKSNLCDLGEFLMRGTPISNDQYRVTARGRGVGTMSLLGTFCDHAVVHETSVVKIDPELPLDVAALVGCGVTTGWGSAVNTAQIRPGETVVVTGAGGVGINAVQGAAFAGAEHVVVIEPVGWKREVALQFGATHTAADAEEGFALVRELTRGVMADAAIVTVGVVTPDVIPAQIGLISKGGRLVVTAITPAAQTSVTMSMLEVTMFEKQIRGTCYGSSSPTIAVPKLLSLYKAGKLKLDELITKRYKLDDLNVGYDDMYAGKNFRGLIEFPS